MTPGDDPERYLLKSHNAAAVARNFLTRAPTIWPAGSRCAGRASAGRSPATR